MKYFYQFKYNLETNHFTNLFINEKYNYKFIIKEYLLYKIYSLFNNENICYT